ncbi:MAG: hypothetical protein M1823_003810 [Watsoniomyces obsoletus]|nr:MAG: hypothetical protein M1823_003810 [Watsoniomyces obsoletus]
MLWRHIKKNLHKKWHLMTNEEWVAMYRSIEQLAADKAPLKRALLNPDTGEIKRGKIADALEKLFRKASKQLNDPTDKSRSPPPSSDSQTGEPARGEWSAAHGFYDPARGSVHPEQSHRPPTSK